MLFLLLVSTALVAHSAPVIRDFHLQNGLDAQKLNAQFKTLTNTSTCTDGEQACVGNSFAQCVQGTFALSPCSGGTICAALPLVNKAGTSITCDTASDAADRIAQTGATGGIDGSATGSSDAGSSATSSAATPAPSNSSSDFLKQNGIDAQKLNAKFATLAADSPCTDGEEACIGTATGLCVNGSFLVVPCATSTICGAIPLLDMPGTIVACDTSSDIDDRIAQTGVTGGIDGSGSSQPDESCTATATTTSSSPTSTAPASSDFHLQNGLDAQKLNAKFANLSASTSCTEGQQACVGTSFAQCVSGSFVLTPCATGLVCAALPLVNKPGTSITCDSSADVEARIAATGAPGGITGSSS
ncbi:hypothetical protein C8F01DRAFT_1124096 [Mycena amicta]|nr:hypothetical protein C8F01DRAFT_1124096 [Mycena amicta]